MMSFSYGILVLAVVASLFAADGLFSGFYLNREMAANSGSFVYPEAARPTSSGYIDVIPASGRARMFYAFYEAIKPLNSSLTDVPLILWLQGGPGCSGMTGNFYELGPWRTDTDLLLHKNDFPWNHRYGVIFVDNPIGAGYSIAEKDKDIPENQEQVVTHLYSFLSGFFELFPTFRSRPFFIAGESYGGKYVPALGHYIMRQAGLLGNAPASCSRNPLQSFPKLRVDGLLIGNGLTHPIVQVQNHGITAYSFGLIDSNQMAQVNEWAREVVELTEAEEWHKAYEGRTKIVDWISDVSKIATLLDVRRNVPYHCGQDGTEFLRKFLNRAPVKEVLKAEIATDWVPCNDRARKRLNDDTMKSVKWMVEEMLPKLPILFYQGQFDAKDGVASGEEWMKTLVWAETESFFTSNRAIWRVDGRVAGYWRTHHTLSHVVVLGAGHEVPADQNRHSQDMVEKWISKVLDHSPSQK